MKLILTVALLCVSLAAAPRVTGQRKLWNRITLTFDGPLTNEDATPNPFRNYRLNVTFTHAGSGGEVAVPGFFAADGKAAESSAKAGNKWRVHFTPDQAGEWKYKASFREGEDVAMSLEKDAGKPAAFDGATGSFRVQAAAGRGLLRYTGGHYLQFAGTKEYFLKGGADSPENFLAYFEFDGTFDTDAKTNEGMSSGDRSFLHHYGPHAKDWKPGDPVWQKTKGKNIIGALNYLASKGVDSVYFLTYNIDGGDGRDVWMWTSPEVRDRYDVSKLDQWETVFSHMDKLGIQLHVITQETENDRKLGGSPGLNPVRKLYYRELVARFAHHLAVMWNQGEENNASDPDRKEIARYIRALDVYQHPITVHSKNNRAPDFYSGLLGDGFFEATSIQGSMQNYNRDAIVLRERSAKAGRKWAIFGDEQPGAQVGVMPDADDPGHDIPRIEALWGNLLGGGSGVEWYFGYKFPNMELNCEDFRSRDKMWDQTRIALDFFRKHLPFWEMEPANGLAPGARVFARKGSIYAVQLPKGGTAKLALDGGSYSVSWFNPRTGAMTAGGDTTGPLGPPPAEPDRDWVALVKRK